MNETSVQFYNFSRTLRADLVKLKAMMNILPVLQTCVGRVKVR
jgi:hypothetical protein